MCEFAYTTFSCMFAIHAYLQHSGQYLPLSHSAADPALDTLTLAYS